MQPKKKCLSQKGKRKKPSREDRTPIPEVSQSKSIIKKDFCKMANVFGASPQKEEKKTQMGSGGGIEIPNWKEGKTKRKKKKTLRSAPSVLGRRPLGFGIRRGRIPLVEPASQACFGRGCCGRAPLGKLSAAVCVRVGRADGRVRTTGRCFLATAQAKHGQACAGNASSLCRGSVVGGFCRSVSEDPTAPRGPRVPVLFSGKFSWCFLPKVEPRRSFGVC